MGASSRKNKSTGHWSSQSQLLQQIQHGNILPATRCLQVVDTQQMQASEMLPALFARLQETSLSQRGPLHPPWYRNTSIASSCYVACKIELEVMMRTKVKQGLLAIQEETVLINQLKTQLEYSIFPLQHESTFCS